MKTANSMYKGSGTLLPLHFLYFLYYLGCRRDQTKWPQLERPAITAAGFLTIVLAWPIYAFLNLLNYFTGWLSIGARWWLALNMPMLKHSPEASVFMFAVLVTDFLIYAIAFRKKKYYQRIMQYFSAYDPTARVAMPGVFLIVPIFFVMCIAILTTHANPIFPNMVILAIAIFTEVFFRGWWYRWSKQNAPTKIL